MRWPDAFHHFGNVRFDLMMASDVLSHEVTVLARQFPNVYLSGYWWHNFFPPTIEKIVGMRVQMAPMTKIGGFLCDAYYVEWTYGKLQVVKKAMAAALARLVESGFYEEEEVPPLLHQILHDTPRDLYDLGRGTGSGSVRRSLPPWGCSSAEQPGRREKSVPF